MSNYLEFKRNVFLDPIQNVVIIDDRFPTYQQLLNKSDITDFETDKAASLFDYFSQQGKLCVIENAIENCGVGARVPSYLTNADLLILDYHLTAGDDTDGSRAREILSKVAVSESFNLVVVYTGAIDLDTVSVEIAASLKKREVIENADEISRLIDEIEDETPDFSENISGHLTWELKAKFLSGVAVRPDEYQDIYSYVNSILKGAQKPHCKGVIKYFLLKEFSFVDSFSVSESLSITLGSSRIIWSSNFALVVVGKDKTPEELMGVLTSSVQGLDLSPVHVAFQSMINEVRNNAPVHVAAITKKTNLMDGLLLNASKKSSVAALARSFLSELSTSIENKWLHTCDGELREKFDDYSISANEDVYHAVNMHLCAYPFVKSQHLTTGIVLQDQCSKEYWVVLNCSCDLIPVTEQSSLKWAVALAPEHPFTAVKLEQGPVRRGLKKANNCRTVFLSQNEEKIALSFPENGNPHYEVFYADNNGVFSEGRLKAQQVVRKLIIPDLQLISFEVVAQLRYEYASRFLNMLSAHKSRIGVDFLEMK